MSIAVPSIGPRYFFIGDPTTAAGADMLDVGLVRRVRLARTPRVKVGTTESGAENHEAKFYQGTALTLEVEVARSVSTGLRTYLETINSSDEYLALGTGMDGLTVALVHPADAAGGAAQSSAKTIWIPSVRLTNAGTQEYNADGDGPDDSNFVTLTFEAGYRASDQDATAVPLGALPDFRGDELSGHSLAWSLPPPAGPAGGGGDVTAPVVSGFTVTTPSAQIVRVTVTADEMAATASVPISLAGTGVVTTLTAGDFSGSGPYVADYDAGQDGTFSAVLNTWEDAAGNDGAGSETDNVAIDTTAPSLPTSFTATAGDGEVDLAWTNPADADLASIKIYRGTVSGSLSLLTTHTATGEEGNADSYTDSTAANGTEYFYAITSVDDTGNESAQTSEASATPAAASGVLDAYEVNIEAAYAPALLLASYTGPVQEWRRSSDDATADVYLDASGRVSGTSPVDTDASGSGDDGDFATWLGSDTGTLITEYDHSGNGRHRTQATTTLQPQVAVSGTLLSIGTLDATPDYDGVDDFTQDTGWSVAQPNTIHAILLPDDLSDTQYPVDSAASAERQLLGFDGTQFRVYAGSTVEDFGTAAVEAQVFSALFDGTDSEQFLDGFRIDARDGGGTEALGGLTVGAAFDGTSAPYGGRVGAVVVASSPTDAQTHGIDTALCNLVGLTPYDPPSDAYFRVEGESRGLVFLDADARYPHGCRHADGTYRLVWRNATSSHGSKGTIDTATSSDGETWTTPAQMLTDATLDLRDPSLTLLANGDLALTYVKVDHTIDGQLTSIKGSYFRRSTDDGATWGSEVQIAGTEFTILAPVVEMTNGDLLVTMYDSNVSGGENIYVYESTDNGATWSERSKPSTSGTNTEPYMLELASGDLTIFTRLRRFVSTDDGATWAEGDCDLVTGNVPSVAQATNGALVCGVRYTPDSGHSRLAWSGDDGETWVSYLEPDDGGGQARAVFIEMDTANQFVYAHTSGSDLYTGIVTVLQ